MQTHYQLSYISSCTTHHFSTLIDLLDISMAYFPQFLSFQDRLHGFIFFIRQTPQQSSNIKTFVRWLLTSMFFLSRNLINACMYFSSIEDSNQCSLVTQTSGNRLFCHVLRYVFRRFPLKLIHCFFQNDTFTEVASPTVGVDFVSGFFSCWT